MRGGGRGDSSGIREEGKAKTALKKAVFLLVFMAGASRKAEDGALSTGAGRETVRRNNRSVGVCKKEQRVSIKSTAHRMTGEKQSGIAGREEYL